MQSKKETIKRHNEFEKPLFSVGICIPSMCVLPTVHFNLRIFQVLLLFMWYFSHIQATCDTIFSGSGDYYNCSGSLCTLYSSAKFSIPTGTSNVCFNIKSSTTSEDAVNIIISQTEITNKYVLDSCYTTNDPSVSFTGLCKCPATYVIDCNNCPILTSPNDVEVCGSGLTAPTGCLFGGVATWCERTFFDVGNRFTVCEVGDFDYMMSVNVSINGASNTYSVTPTSNVLSVSGYSIEVKPSIKEGGIVGKYLVIDNDAPSSVYLFPNKMVNSIEEVDYSKLGWAKYNSRAWLSGIPSILTVVVVDCSTDMFSYNLNAALFKNYLGSTSFSLQILHPGSVYSGPTCPVNQFSSVNDPTSTPDENQVSCLGFGGAPVVLGVNSDGGSDVPMTITNHVVLTAGVTFQSLQGTIITPNRCSPTYTLQNSKNQFIYATQCTNKIFGPYTTGSVSICWRNASAVPSTWSCSGTLVCRTSPLGAYSEFQYISGSKVVTFSTTMTNTFPTTLTVPNTLQSVEYTLNGVFDTIYLENNKMQPLIISVYPNNEILDVSAKSYSGRGTCLISTDPKVTTDTPVELDYKENNYELPIVVRKYDGKVVLTIVCSTNRDKVSFDLSVEKSDTIIDFDTIKDENIRHVSRESYFDQVVAVSSSTSNSLWSVIKGVFGFNWFSSLLYYFLIYAITVSSVLVVGILILSSGWFLWKMIVRWCFKPKRSLATVAIPRG